MKNVMTNAQTQEQNPYADAVAHHKAGRLEEAEAAFSDAVAARENDPEAHNMIGIFYFQTRRPEKALPHFEKAVTLGGAHIDYYKNLAAAQLHTGDFRAAEDTLRKALRDKPDYAEGHFNLGIALEQQKRLPEAIESYKTATEKAPLLDACNNLGRLYLLTGQNTEAEKTFKEALALNENYDKAAANLCALYQATGRLNEALAMAIKAVNMNPSKTNNKIMLTSLIEGSSVKSFSAPLKEALTHVLQDRNVDQRRAAHNWCALLRLDPAFAPWMKAAQARTYDDFTAHLLKADFAALNDDFVIAGLQETINCDEDLERLFTYLRRYLLEMIADMDLPPDDEEMGAFPYALAEQCFYNDYVFFLSDIEKEWLEKLHEKIEALKTVKEEHHLPLAVYAACRPLSHLNNAATIESAAGESGNDRLRMLTGAQITAPRQEAEIAKTIVTIGNLARDESAAFMEAYEQNPYPRWKSCDMAQNPLDHLQDKNLRDKQRPQVLVAGCGTGRHAIGASQRYRHADILAVDFSRPALAYAVRKTRELGIKNITYKQADILELDECGENSFDAVECIGTLHHMRDPLAGWAALNKRLKPGGSIIIGTYSKAARQGIEATRAFTGKEGFDATPDGIRAARQAIFGLPAGDPARDVVSYIDFYTLSECRFHIMDIEEHPLTLPEIGAFMAENNLRLERFYGIAPAYVALYKERHPDDAAMTNLENWHELEQEHPALFGAMYQFIARKG